MIRTLKGKPFSMWLADRLATEELLKQRLIDMDIAESIIVECYDAMDRMISGEYDTEPTEVIPFQVMKR
jgi:hypothetical protein